MRGKAIDTLHRALVAWNKALAEVDFDDPKSAQKYQERAARYQRTAGRALNRLGFDNVLGEAAETAHRRHISDNLPGFVRIYQEIEASHPGGIPALPEDMQI